MLTNLRNTCVRVDRALKSILFPSPTEMAAWLQSGAVLSSTKIPNTTEEPRD